MKQDDLVVPHKLTSDRAAIVSTEVCWMSIDDKTPLGIKMMLITKLQGIAVISIRRIQDGWTHWYPLPRFGDEK